METKPISHITGFFLDYEHSSHYNEDMFLYKMMSPYEMLEMTNEELEAAHDVIQWMFPLHERSYHSLNTPVLTEADIELLSKSVDAQINIIKFYNRMLDFLLGENGENVKKWCFEGNHNLLRITRIIRSLRLFGLEELAKDFYIVMNRIGVEEGLPKKTFEYWDAAMFEDKMSSMTDRFLKDREIRL